MPTNWLPPTTTVFLAVGPPFTEAMSVARRVGFAFACASELRPIFVRASVKVPLFPLASLYGVLAKTTDVIFMTVRLPTFFMLFTDPLIWIDPEHAAPLQLIVTGASRVLPASTMEVEVMTTLGFVFDAAPAARSIQRPGASLSQE